MHADAILSGRRNTNRCRCRLWVEAVVVSLGFPSSSVLHDTNSQCTVAIYLGNLTFFPRLVKCQRNELMDKGSRLEPCSVSFNKTIFKTYVITSSCRSIDLVNNDAHRSFGANGRSRLKCWLNTIFDHLSCTSVTMERNLDEHITGNLYTTVPLAIRTWHLFPKRHNRHVVLPHVLMWSYLVQQVPKGGESVKHCVNVYVSV